MALFKRKPKAAPVEGEKQGQLAVIKDAFVLTKREKPMALVIAAGVVVAVFIVIEILASLGGGSPIYFGIVGLPLSLLGGFIYFTRAANGAAFASIENQLGAAASVLMAIRKGVSTTPAARVNREQDMVHRSVSRAGIILTGEGGRGVRQLMIDEHKHMDRFVQGVPVTEVYVGNGEGQVKLRKLQKHIKKLPKKLSNAQMREVRNRIKAVGGMNMPIPKGPMPKNVKMPKR